MDDGSGLLLSAFCNGEEVLVIDNTSVNNKEIFTEDILKRCLFISHNADFECRWGVQLGFLPGRYACTMVNEKRLLSGQDGFRYGLIPTINRRLGYKHIPIWMDKDLREQFRDCKFFTDELILYNAGDTTKLIQLYYKQLEEAEKLGQLFLHNTINSRIIIPIAQAEVRGIKHKSDTWIQIARDRQTKATAICQELNEIVINQHGLNPGTINPLIRKKQDSYEKAVKKKEERVVKLQTLLRNLEVKEKTHLKSYKTSLEQLDKLQSTTLELELEDTGLINWGSQKQVLEIFRSIGIPLPTANDKKTKEMKSGVGKEHRSNWFIEYSSSTFYPIMKKFDTYKKLIHNVRSFGQSWVEQCVRNGRAYTLFDQAGTATGRMSSGSKGVKKANKHYMNISQIPSDTDYRSCFIADDNRVMGTFDYKNQEGVIMISLSGDMKMKQITEMSDSHSWLGQKAWRAVYEYKFNKTKDEQWKVLSETYVMDQSTPEKVKERSKFKNSGGLFPTAYGTGPGKIAATAGLTIEEAQVMLDTVKNEVPGAIKFLDSKSHEASTLGYTIHNDRTNSRRWFTPILDQVHYGFKVSKKEKVKAEMAARNSCIQGSASDMMKECIAMVDCFNRIYKTDIWFVLSNYDEYVGSFPVNKAEQYARIVSSFMERAANNYLIKEIRMKSSGELDTCWKK